MPKQQATRLGTTITIVGAILLPFTVWAFFPAILGFLLLGYGTTE